MRVFYLWLCSIFLFVCFALAVAQRIVICSACGREATVVTNICLHCKAALPGFDKVVPAEPATPPSVDVESEDVAALAYKAFMAVVATARSLEEKNPERALHEYDCAVSLAQLVSDTQYTPAMGEELLRKREQTLQRLKIGRDICRKCKGSGRYQMDMGKVDGGKSGIRSATGVACPVCKGSGGYIAPREADQIKALIVRGRSDYERYQLVAGSVRLGRIYIPSELEQKLNTRQRALLMSGVPVPCNMCQLSGLQMCRECRSSGWVKCKGSGCKDGMITEEERRTGVRQVRRLNDMQQKPCPVCDGQGETVCTTCRGSKSINCSKCNGSGKALRCQRCTGTGLFTCTQCKGSGTVRGAPCTNCRGEGVVLCTSCKGEGAISR